MIHHRFHLAILGALLNISLFVASPLFDFVLAVKEYPILDREFARVKIGDSSVFAEVARTPDAQRRGLSDKSFLGSENGMLFVFEEYGYPAIWMKNMKFPIDIIWISGNRVVDIEENVPPPAPGTPDERLSVYRPDARANLVLEVDGGFTNANNVRIGDALSFISQAEIDAVLEKKILENRKEQLRYLRSILLKEELTIDALRKRAYTGRDFTIVKIVAENSVYTKYQISYKSDGLTISGVMNVPKTGTLPFPVVILNHGYIDPDEYTTGRGSRREQDYFVRRGYITVHPDYRGHAFSDADTASRYDFNVGYTIDVINLIEALKKFSAGDGSASGGKSLIIDMSRVGMWGHSMGGGITERVMVLRDDIRAYVLFAPISSNVSDNLYLVQGKITDILKDYGPVEQSQKFFDEISPFYYLSSVSAPVMIHHGTEDTIVPLYFSRTLNRTLLKKGKTSLLFSYEGERHEFTKAWPLVMTRSLNFFDQFVKYPKKTKMAPAKK